MFHLNVVIDFIKRESFTRVLSLEYFAFLFLFFSYLVVDGYSPWISFNKEVLSICYLVSLLIFICYNKINLIFDKKILKFSIFVYGIIFFQYAFGLIFYFQDFFIVLSYLSFFLLSFIVGNSFKLSRKFNLVFLEKTFILFILIGLFSVIIQILQWFSVDYFFVRELYGSRPFANLGQPNHLSTLLMFSIFSLYYFLENKLISDKWFFFIVITLCFGLALTQSRGAFISFSVGTLICILYQDIRSRINYLLPFVFYLLSFIFIPIVDKFISQKMQSVLIRVSHDASSRIDIWYQMYLAILKKPYVGYGWNQTSVAQVSLNDTYPISNWLQYSHNLFVDLIIWNGIPLGVILITFIVYITLKLFFSIKGYDELFSFLLYLSFFIHSLVEYPFSYLYFLIPVGIFLGYLNSSGNIACIQPNFRAYLFILFIIILFCFVLNEYLKIKEKMYNYSISYLVNRKVEVIKDNIFFLDGLDMVVEMRYKDKCDILAYRNDLKKLAYRYPFSPNLYNYSFVLEREHNFIEQKRILNVYNAMMKSKFERFNYNVVGCHFNK